MTQRAGIVTTLINAGEVLDSFITYHTSIGFERFFLFFDDPNDPSIEQARKHPNVTVIKTDDELRARWKSGRLYAVDKLMARRAIYSPITERQSLNVEVALGLAKEEGLDWLLHIDIDELFFSPGKDVREHFQDMTDHGIRIVKYMNYEGIPEKPDIVDYFRDVTLFRRHPSVFDRATMAQKRNMIREVFGERYYLFYMVGKAAARVSDDILPSGVHEFMMMSELRFPGSLFRPESPFAKMAYRNPILNLFVSIMTRRRGRHVSINPIVLHYPCCGFQHFWNKYVTMGRFPDAPGEKIFHADCRDVVQEGDEEKARKFYQDNIVYTDQVTIKRFIENKVLCRVFEPSAFIKRTAETAAGVATTTD